MPSTRSQSHAQPMLDFPRRKSCRVSSRSKIQDVTQVSVQSPTKPQLLTQTLARIRPLSPRRSDHQPTPLSPIRSVALPPNLQPRLPLSPRKRTGEHLSEQSLFSLILDSRSFCFRLPVKGMTTAATSVPARWVHLQSKARRLWRRPVSSALMRIPQLQLADSCCLCHHHMQTLLLHHHQGARRHPSKAQHAQILRGNCQMHIYLIKVNPISPCKRLFHPSLRTKTKCFDHLVLQQSQSFRVWSRRSILPSQSGSCPERLNGNPSDRSWRRKLCSVTLVASTSLEPQGQARLPVSTVFFRKWR